MPHVEVELDLGAIERLVSQLRADDQRRLAQRLAAQQMDRIVGKLRRRVRGLGLTPRDLAGLVAQVRQRRYAHRRP